MGTRPVFYSRVSQPFAAPGGYASRSDRHGRAGHHTGVDFGSLWPIPIESKPVRSSTPGVVVISEYDSTMGHWVGVYFARDDVTITYWHMGGRTVRVGQRVKKWQKLGNVGSTGNSSAPHLHVQVNPGRGFDYHGHVSPAKWCRGGQGWREYLRRQRMRLKRRRR